MTNECIPSSIVPNDRAIPVATDVLFREGIVFSPVKGTVLTWS